MSKKITQIHSTTIGKIRTNDNLGIMSQDGLISKIDYNYPDDGCNESYVVHFEKSKRTLEVFDVNYVIRDEE